MSQTLEKILLEDNLVDPEDLVQAQKLQKKNKVPIGQILIKKGSLSEFDLLRAMGKLYGLPTQEKIEFDPENNPFEGMEIPYRLLEKNKIVPFAIKRRKVYLAVSDPLNLHPVDDFSAAVSTQGYRVEPVLVPETEILRVLHSYFDRRTADREQIIDEYSDGDLEILSDTASDDALDMANEAPIIKMVNVIISQAVHEGASDVHLEPFEKNFDVRFRVDGVMHKILSPPKQIQSGIISRIKIMSNLNIAENRLPQDGRIKLKVMGKDIDIRVSSIPVQFGERIVMRILNKTDMNFSLENLGMPAEMEKQIKSVLSMPNGIFLVTGPTGSGKSTTLYSGLSYLNSPEKNIMTVEDPVEYQIAGIAQTQMKSSIGLTFAAALRSILRQDPDVIMVGEIRDQETAQVAAQAALTGHMVFSTLHTNDASSAVTRMIDMQIEPFLITSTVRAVLAQRLLRRLCTDCRVEVKPDADIAQELGIHGKGARSKKIYKATGCPKCLQTGYKGRVGIYELLPISRQVTHLILEGADANAIFDQARSEGMRTLREDGYAKVLAGVTTMEEVNRVA